MTPVARTASALLTLGILALFPGAVRARDSADLDCTMRFSLSTWSALQKHSEGSGIVTCEKGQSLRVRIVARGAGLAVGKSHVDGGTGRFADVHNMAEIFGSYADVEVHAGVAKPANSKVLTKGTLSLAIAGNGEGVDLGSGVGEFTLTRGGE